MFQDSWGRLSLKCKVDWYQGFVIRDDSEVWQYIQVDMILDNSKFYGSTFFAPGALSICCHNVQSDAATSLGLAL